MLPGVSLVDLAIDPGFKNAPSRVDVDRFRILLAVHCDTLPPRVVVLRDGSRGESKTPRVLCMAAHHASVLSKDAVWVIM